MKSIIDDLNFKFSDNYHVIYFYKSEMPFNNRMVNILSNLELKYKDITFNMVDVYNIKSFIKRFNIKEVPTLCIYNNGNEIDRVVGIVMASALKSLFNKILVKENYGK